MWNIPPKSQGFSRQVIFPPFEASSYSVDRVDEAPAASDIVGWKQQVQLLETGW